MIIVFDTHRALEAISVENPFAQVRLPENENAVLASLWR